MNMMEANVTGKPVTNPRKFVVSASFHSGNYIIPIFFSAFINVFVLMLDIEKPKRISSEEKQVDELHN